MRGTGEDGDGTAIAAYRMLRTRLLHRARARHWTSIAVTSAGPSDGKTLTVLNLALSMAREKSREIVVLDMDLNVVWTWDTFDNLDVTRKAVLGETCATEGACPPYALASNANDWTHGNAITETVDGNLLYSTRHQDWVIKISYGHGNGDGHIIWKMGVDGDFQINSSDPYPWFSHQHDSNFELSNPSRLLVFDDGNTRVSVLGGGNSRGQVLQVDEQNMVVTPVLNADLGYYAAAVGSAQLLMDGNYHFDLGFVQENKTIDSYSLEVAPGGQIVYNAHQNTILYRTFRLVDMYHLY